MKKISISIFVFLIIFIFPILCFSEAWKVDPVTFDEKFTVAVDTGAAIALESDMGVGTYVKGLLSYDVSNNLAIGLEPGCAVYEAEDSGVNVGNLVLCTVMADAVLKYPVMINDVKIVPYLLNGLGVLMSSMEKDEDFNGTAGSSDNNVDFAYRVAMGVDLHLEDVLALYIEAGYLWSTFDWKVTNSSGNQTSLRADAIYLGGGFKGRF